MFLKKNESATAQKDNSQAVLDIANDFAIASDWVTVPCFKVMFIGASGAGKSSLIKCLLGGNVDTCISHVTPGSKEREQLVAFVKGMFRYVEWPGIEQYSDSELESLQSHLEKNETSLILFCHNLSSRVLPASLSKVLHIIRNSHVPTLYVYTNKYSIPSETRDSVVLESQRTMNIPSDKCFVINSALFDKRPVENVIELINSVCNILNPEERNVFVHNLSLERQQEYDRFMRKVSVISGVSASMVAISTLGAIYAVSNLSRNILNIIKKS